MVDPSALSATCRRPRLGLAERVGVVGFRYPAVIEAVDELTALAVRLLGSRDLVAATGEVLGGDIDA